ncbi:GW dipeptide domain-containing protein [Levilactobacillus brevis]|uniref:GW dipeptide domain-containing protein n=1 Tax=Levilactobacillus brevis TaxID=1580 RepID=UPI0022E280EE|nr:GW dipeptide domain-containing protein [Levilactobacillus brevis]
MLKYKKVFITAITILGMLTLGGTLKGQANVIKSARHYNLRVLKSGAKSRKNLIAKDSQVKQKYLKKSYQLDELAKVGHQNYFQISRRGKPLGWVNAKYLKKQSISYRIRIPVNSTRCTHLMHVKRLVSKWHCQ